MLVYCMLGLVASVARAQAPVSLAGRWQAEPMTVRWVIGEWGEACGPKPNGGGDGGGVVTIEEQAGELSIKGADRAYVSSQCWDENPQLARQTHSALQRAWKTTCRTPRNDGRQQILQTSISATDDVISFQESGQYQFTIRGQTCAASSGRWRTYRRLGAELVAPPPEVPLEPRPAANPCATPGLPARIEVRPARKLMRAGESFEFQVAVFDARGCAARTNVTWEVAPPGSPVQLAEGLLAVPEGAGDAELEIVATAANQSVRVKVDVVSNERYAALLAGGNFNADGASKDAQTATITSGSLGAQVPAQAEPHGRKWTFVGLVSAIALLFGLLGAWLLRRANRQAAAVAAERTASLGSGTALFPGDRTALERPASRISDRTRLEPVSRMATPAQPKLVCPVCGTMYEGKDLRACPKDAAQLLPINA
jgi:hypothetical protein